MDVTRTKKQCSIFTYRYSIVIFNNRRSREEDDKLGAGNNFLTDDNVKSGGVELISSSSSAMEAGRRATAPSGRIRHVRHIIQKWFITPILTEYCIIIVVSSEHWWLWRWWRSGFADWRGRGFRGCWRRRRRLPARGSRRWRDAQRR